MKVSDLLVEAYGRILGSVGPAVDGLTEDQLTQRVDPNANTIAWLVWHLARVQDDHVVGVFGGEQVWTSDGWSDRFALPFDPSEIGYGFTSEQVGQVRAPSGLLLGYYEAVHARTLEHLRGLGDDDLDRVVDASYDPPVTVAVRLVSVLTDDLEHVGQAALLRGVIERAA